LPTCHGWSFKVYVSLTFIPSKKRNSFCKTLSYGPKKVGRGNKSGTRHVWPLECPHINYKTLIKTCFTSWVILFQETLEFKQTIKSIVIDTSRPCAKSTSLGYSPNCCKYIFWVPWFNNVHWTKAIDFFVQCLCCSHIICM